MNANTPIDLRWAHCGQAQQGPWRLAWAQLIEVPPAQRDPGRVEAGDHNHRPRRPGQRWQLTGPQQ